MSDSPKASAFLTTQWSMVIHAGVGEGTVAYDAMSVLCKRYWSPLYKYARRCGHSTTDAEDLTQVFFATVLTGDLIGKADPDKGRFRAFLLTAMKRYMANEYHRAQAQKRGGGKVIPMSVATADSELSIEAVDNKDNPEDAFDRHWAMSLLESVMHRLRDSYRSDIDRFEVLKCCLLPGQNAPSYRDLGADLGMSEGAVKVAIHRMRKRYGRLLRQEVADTLSDPTDVDQELRLLLQALAR